jgi:hypothetical protein
MFLYNFDILVSKIKKYFNIFLIKKYYAPQYFIGFFNYL